MQEYVAARLQGTCRPRVERVQSKNQWITPYDDGREALCEKAEKCSSSWKFDWTHQQCSAGSKSRKVVASQQSRERRFRAIRQAHARLPGRAAARTPPVLLPPTSGRPRAAQSSRVLWSFQVGNRRRRSHRNAANWVNGSGAQTGAHTLRAV